METLIHVCVSLWHLAHACFSMFKWKITLLSIRYICSFLFIFLSCSVCRVSLLLCLFLKWLRYIESLPCSAVVTFSTCRLSGDTPPPMALVLMLSGVGRMQHWWASRPVPTLTPLSVCCHSHPMLWLREPSAESQAPWCPHSLWQACLLRRTFSFNGFTCSLVISGKVDMLSKVLIFWRIGFQSIRTSHHQEDFWSGCYRK